ICMPTLLFVALRPRNGANPLPTRRSSDLDANFAGSKKSYDLLKPLVTDAEFTARVDANFADVDAVLDKYQAADGSFVSYEELTDADRDVLAAKVNTLAEDLATLRGQLGMS